MKSLIVIISLFSSLAFAGGTFDTFTVGDLVCVRNTWDGAQNCVSKASIEKDKLELEVLKLQMAKLKKEQALADAAEKQAKLEEDEKQKVRLAQQAREDAYLEKMKQVKSKKKVK